MALKKRHIERQTKGTDPLEKIVKPLGPTYICPSCQKNPTHRKGALCYECAPSAEIIRLHGLLSNILEATEKATRANNHGKKNRTKEMEELRQVQEAVKKAIRRNTKEKKPLK